MSDDVQDTPPRLSAKQLRAIGVLLAARSLTEAAAMLQVNEKTLRRWLLHPLFVLELRAAEGVLLDAAVRRLLTLHATALDTLATVLTDPAVTASVRVRAATAILDLSLKLREVRSIEARLTALEVGETLGAAHDTSTPSGA